MKQLSGRVPTKQRVFYIQLLERERKLQTGSHVRTACIEIGREWTVFDVSAIPESILFLSAPREDHRLPLPPRKTFA